MVPAAIAGIGYGCWEIIYKNAKSAVSLLAKLWPTGINYIMSVFRYVVK